MRWRPSSSVSASKVLKIFVLEDKGFRFRKPVRTSLTLSHWWRYLTGWIGTRLHLTPIVGVLSMSRRSQRNSDLKLNKYIRWCCWKVTWLFCLRRTFTNLLLIIMSFNYSVFWLFCRRYCSLKRASVFFNETFSLSPPVSNERTLIELEKLLNWFKSYIYAQKPKNSLSKELVIDKISTYSPINWKTH